MIANCPGCTPAAADVRELSPARARLPWLALLPAILYALGEGKDCDVISAMGRVASPTMTHGARP
jgi:hypothetical protein